MNAPNKVMKDDDDNNDDGGDDCLHNVFEAEDMTITEGKTQKKLLICIIR